MIETILANRGWASDKRVKNIRIFLIIYILRLKARIQKLRYVEFVMEVRLADKMKKGENDVGYSRRIDLPGPVFCW